MRYDRRDFLKTSGAALACTCLGGLSLHSCSPFSNVSDTAFAPPGSYWIEAAQIVIDLEKTSELTSIGGSVKLEFIHPQDKIMTKIILIHSEALSYLAFANTCTHKGKELEYNPIIKKIQCVSGHSDFDLSGEVLKGNAVKPLKVYLTELEGNILFVRI